MYLLWCFVIQGYSHNVSKYSVRGESVIDVWLSIAWVTQGTVPDYFNRLCGNQKQLLNDVLSFGRNVKVHA